MHHKKNLKHTNNVPDWRYWHVFEEYMVNRPNSSDSDFMAEDDFSLIEHPVNVNNRVDRKFCRICLQRERPAFPENIISIFGPLNATIRINEALGVCFGLEIFDEQNSSEENQICLDCLKRLDAAYHFRKLCWESQCRLKYNRMFPHLEDGRNETAIDSCQVEESTKNYNQSQDESSLSGFAATFAFDEEFVDTKPKDGTASKIDEKCAVMQPDKFDDKIPEESIGQVDKLTNFQCSICMKKFPNIEYIKKHLVTIHSLISDSQNFRNYLELSNCDSDDELNDNVKCYICGKIYVRREYLKKHLKLIHNVTDADYNVYERIDEANKTTKPLLCHSCGESFVLKHVFKKHIEHHERGSLLSCDYCDIKLVDKSSVERHMVLHTGQRNYKCIFCAKGFFTRISQKRHERNVHTKEKSHICQYCNKKFVMWKFLERHLNTHTAEVVYQCDQCDKKYLNKNHLRVHKFRHAKEPPFKCSVCSKAYFDRSTLKKHNYVHIGNPHQCSHCERSFDRRDKMNAHIRKTHGLSKLNDNDGNTQKM
ncbi:Zinc finger protein [Pseudolycoriella hygida]|uniref:Zinc finger protein n=1 Tax=Pseudolycoriella hygida TaxID=35572 RepID=A0A9Q0MYT4_9DIPT|nr:Zinc finger protein [Pseudolycoriella hygida]